MNKIYYLLVFIVFFTLLCCADKEAKKEDVKIKLQNKTEKPNLSKEDSKDELIVLGKKLFSDKTCTTCHHIDKKIIGPSIKAINEIYHAKNADLIDFLKGELEPIVDTDPVQVAVMKANLDGFVKDLSDRELKALKAYMLSIK